MARQKNIQTRDDGSLFYPLERTRKIPVPGTKGLKLTEKMEVPQVNADGEADTVMQNLLNIVDGKDDAERVKKLVSIVNAGLVMEATSKIQTLLNSKLNANQVVSDFATIVAATKSMFTGMSDGERATLMLEKLPQVAEMLKSAGLELATDDDDETEDDDSEE